MKIYTSYFYMVRFLHSHEIPISTAVWDSKWFHDFKGQQHTFFDKRDVVNGFRFEPFVPNRTCNTLCRGPETCTTQDPNTCRFLAAYAKQISAVPKEELLAYCAELEKKWQEFTGSSTECDFVLLFHEKPDNPCSERWVVQNWLKKNSIDFTEYEKH